MVLLQNHADLREAVFRQTLAQVQSHLRGTATCRELFRFKSSTRSRYCAETARCICSMVHAPGRLSSAIRRMALRKLFEIGRHAATRSDQRTSERSNPDVLFTLPAMRRHIVGQGDPSDGLAIEDATSCEIRASSLQ